MNLRDFISRFIFYPFVYERVVRNCRSLYQKKREVQSLPTSEIKKIQLKRLKEILIFSYEKTKYYRQVFDKIKFNPYQFSDFNQIKKIPILTKKIIQKDLKELLANSVDDLIKNTTGGSTGKPAIFYADKNFNSHTVANAWVSDEFVGWFPGCRVARLWGHPFDYENTKKFLVKLRYWLMNVNYYDAFNMSCKKMAEYHRQLSFFQPDVILAYASSIFLLAKFLKEKKLKSTYPKKGIISSAEKLHPYMRETIEEVFNCRISDRYGGREIGIVATECQKGKMHLHPLDSFIEVVDFKNNNRDLVGNEGRILITLLNNFGMPLIRYDVGDVAKLSKSNCDCGRKTTFFTNITGRTSDVIKLSDGRLVHGEYFTHSVYYIEGVKQFQFVQEKPNFFVIKIVKDKRWKKSSLAKVKKECFKVLKEGRDTLVIKFVKKINTEKSGKYRFTISNLK